MGAKEEVQYIDGLVHFADKDFEGAKSLLLPLAQSRSAVHSLWALLWLVDIYAEHGDYIQAVNLLTQGVAAGLDNYHLFLDRADLLCRLNERKACIQDINRAITEAKGSDDVLLNASRILGRAAFSTPRSNRKEIRKTLAILEARLGQVSYGTISALARSRVHGELLLADGNVSGSLEEFNKADKLDPPIACRDYLSRALTAAADQERDPQIAQRLRRRAMEILRPVAFHTGPLWQLQDDYPPGFYADQLEAWMRLAQESGTERSEIDDVRNRLKAVRPGPSISL
jgi:tetratricopeptide (TPR) repeat protein